MQWNKGEKREEVVHINWKQRNKTVLQVYIANYIIIYIGKCQRLYKKKFARLSEFNKITGFTVYENKLYFYMLSMNNCVLHFKKTIIYNESRSDKILWYKSNKTWAISVCWNYKMLMKEIKKDLNKWKYPVFTDWKTQ